MMVFSIIEKEGDLITAFESNFHLTRLVKTTSATHISMVSLEPGTKIGFHKAVVPQVLLVIDGEGFVRTDTQDNQPIKKGQAVSWDKDEGHETITETGLAAIVIEAEELNLHY
ncbi:cupin [Chryseomicrobium sp. FSL W7-1435]|uniref:cupin n=1 Tax=Chryseomicrobium sp. FSL W7-1435 TaxID=2921704 RepID=UPI00315B1098